MLDSRLKAELTEIKSDIRSVGEAAFFRNVALVILLLFYQLQNNSQFREVRSDISEIKALIQPTNYVELKNSTVSVEKVVDKPTE